MSYSCEVEVVLDSAEVGAPGNEEDCPDEDHSHLVQHSSGGRSQFFGNSDA